MVAPLLIEAGLPVIVRVLSGALGTINNPAAQAAAKSLDQVGDALVQGHITPEEAAEANRHAEAIAMMETQETKAAYEQVNESLRAEVASEDAYVRRMRPTFGYLMAVTWAAQMMALAYVITFRTEKAGVVLQAMESLSTIWAVGLSVLGIYVFKRSEEKKTGASVPSMGTPAPERAETPAPARDVRSQASARLPKFND
jgi:hypothetical protein